MLLTIEKNLIFYFGLIKLTPSIFLTFLKQYLYSNLYDIAHIK